ncbi:MAG: MATE family efflux transporter [Clostridia bacterium]|nr:MATE family efflux transporter [Clostridia bacterium]
MVDSTVLNLGKTPANTVFKLSWPAIAEQLLTSMASLIDTAMVSSAGAAATASVAINVSTVWLLNGMFTALSAGYMYIVAHSIGEQRIERACDAARESITASALIGLVLMILVELIIAPNFPVWLGGSDEIIPDARSYMHILGFAMVSQAFTVVFSDVIRGAGNTRLPLLANFIGNICNIIGNFLLIFDTRMVTFFDNSYTLWGAGLGVSGAAISTSMSQTVSGVILFAALFLANTPIKLKFKGDYKLKYQTTIRMLRISIPVLIERMTICVGQVILTGIISGAGTIGLAVHQLVNQVESILYLPAYGFATTATTLVGQSLGANNEKKADEFVHIICVANTLMLIGVCIVVFIFAKQIIAILTPNAEVVRLGNIGLKITAATEPFFAISVVMGGICRGSGDVKFPLIVSLVGMWILRLFPAYLLAFTFGFGVIGIEAAIGFDVTLRGFACVLRLKSGKWKLKKA